MNKHADTIVVGYGDLIPIIMEAKDKHGKWKVIQDRYVVGCGTGVGHIFLPPTILQSLWFPFSQEIIKHNSD